MEFFFSGLIFTVFLSFCSSAPLVLATAIILTCICITLIFWLATSKWLGYSILLIFLGGMMVVFLYASILSSNEKLMFKIKAPASILVFLGVLPFFVYYDLTPIHMILDKPYSPLYRDMMTFLILYLLMALFLVVKISEPLKGTFSKKF